MTLTIVVTYPQTESVPVFQDQGAIPLYGTYSAASFIQHKGYSLLSVSSHCIIW